MGNSQPSAKPKASITGASSALDPTPRRTDGRFVYSRQDARLIRKHLSSFRMATHSDHHDLVVIRGHWDRLCELHKDIEIFDVFHPFLYEMAPELKPLFHCSSGFHGRALMNLIGGIKSVLQAENMVERASRIAQRHVTYGVRCEHFNPVGIALMKTLASLSPPLWTEETCEAWKMVYCHAACEVLRYLEVRVRPQPRQLLAATRLWRTSTSIGIAPSATSTVANARTPKSPSFVTNSIKVAVFGSKTSMLQRANSTSQIPTPSETKTHSHRFKPTTRPKTKSARHNSILTSSPAVQNGPDTMDLEDPYTGQIRRDMLQMVPMQTPQGTTKLPSHNHRKLVRSTSDTSSHRSGSRVDSVDLANIECPYTGHRRREMATELGQHHALAPSDDERDPTTRPIAPRLLKSSFSDRHLMARPMQASPFERQLQQRQMQQYDSAIHSRTCNQGSPRATEIY